MDNSKDLSVEGAISSPESSFITMSDGTPIFYKDWGRGQAVIFSHGWPLDADAWDAQMLFLLQKGYRVIAHDRRGHGRSGQSREGNDMNTYADDLGAILEALNINDGILVGHSTGGGEVVRYISRHGSARLLKCVLIGAVPPVMLRSAANPTGVPREVFDSIRAGVAGNRSQFYRDLAISFYGYNRPDVKTSEGVVDSFWAQGMLGSVHGQYACIREFSEVDYTEDLRKIDIPTLILHGDDDQIVPIDNSGRLSAKIVRNAKLKIIPGASHGMCTVNADQINGELLSFIEGNPRNELQIL